MARQVFRDGKWCDNEKAAPELVRQDLRELPASYLTKDVDDPSKIHQLDPPHIVESQTEDLDNASVAEAPKMLPDILSPKGPPVLCTAHPVNQNLVDIVRCRWLVRFFEREKELLSADAAHRSDFTNRHVWFPENMIGKYTVRWGNAPADADRPAHLRGLDLTLAPLDWPAVLVDALRAAGFPAPTKEEMIAELQMIKRRNALVQLA
jgi:hypothetical protein